MHRLILLALSVSACRAPYTTSDRQFSNRPGSTSINAWEPPSEHDRPGVPKDANLEQITEVALRGNPGLRAAHRAYQAAMERVPQAERLPDPRLTWIEFTEELQTRTGPHSRRLMLSQTFPWPGVRGLRGDVARHAAGAHWQRALALALEVRREVEESWYELAWLEHALRVHRENLALLQQLEPVVQRRIEAGGLQEDVLRLQIEVARIEERTIELERRREPMRARLVAAVGVTGVDLGGAARLLEPEVRDLNPDALHAQALERSPRLGMLVRDVERARAARELAGLDRYPDLTLGVDHLQVDSSGMPGTQGSGDDPLAVRLSLNLPIWKAADDAAEREAGHRLRQSQLDLEQASNELGTQVSMAVFRYEDAGRNLALHRDSLLPRARETLELTRASYRAGAASLLDLIDSERTLLEFELMYWNASRDVLLEESRLRALIGGGLE